MRIDQRYTARTAAGEEGAGSVEEPNHPGAPVAEGNWYDNLDPALRNNPSITKYASPEELAKGHAHAVQSIGADKIVRPRADDPEDINRFYGELGRPEAASEYRLPEGSTLPEVGWDQGSAMRLVDTLHKIGLTQQQFEVLMPAYLQETEQAGQAIAGRAEQVFNETQSTIDREYGLKREESINVGNRAVTAIFGDDAEAISQLPLLQGGILGDHMPYIRAMIAYGETLSEDGGAPAGGGRSTHFSGMTPDQAKKELESLKGNKEFMGDFGDRQAIGHKEARDRWNQLNEYAYKEPEQG